LCRFTNVGLYTLLLIYRPFIKRLQAFCVLTMRFGLKPGFIDAVFIALLISSAAVSSASFDYLYVEASEGNASGGHSAIQFGDEVFHYQHHDSGLIRLLRQDKQAFHFLYRFLQNRRIHLNHIVGRSRYRGGKTKTLQIC